MKSQKFLLFLTNRNEEIAFKDLNILLINFSNKNINSHSSFACFFFKSKFSRNCFMIPNFCISSLDFIHDHIHFISFPHENLPQCSVHSDLIVKSFACVATHTQHIWEMEEQSNCINIRSNSGKLFSRSPLRFSASYSQPKWK